MAGSLCNARRGTRQVACNQPSPRLQLTCEAGDGILAGPLLRMLAGLRAAKGERVGLALALALVPALYQSWQAASATPDVGPGRWLAISPAPDCSSRVRLVTASWLGRCSGCWPG